MIPVSLLNLFCSHVYVDWTSFLLYTSISLLHQLFYLVPKIIINLLKVSALKVFNVVQAISVVNRVSERRRGPSKLLLQLAHIDTHTHMHTHWLYRVSRSSCNRFAICRLKQSFCRRGPTAAALNTIPLRHVAHFASVAKFKWLWKCTRAAWGEDNFKNHSDSAEVKGGVVMLVGA